MKRKNVTTMIATVIIILSIFLYGCNKEVIITDETPLLIDDAPIIVDDTGATQEGMIKVINANNQFALDFYSKIKEEEENIFFSPYSISTALAMTYEGAREQTAEEMQSVFHFPEDSNVRRPAFAKLYNQVNKKDKEYELHTANALWAQEDYPILSEYKNLIFKYYGGGVTNLDFGKDTENSRRIINSWVEKQTNNKIKELIPEGVLNELTRLVLTNAVYFKGEWTKQFDKEKTFDEDFRVSPTNTIKVPMMRLTGREAKFNYAETENLQILEMQYKGEELSMVVLLPKEDNLESLEHSLTVEKLIEWRNSLAEEKVYVYVPKFTFETKYFMSNVLESMGMPIAFSDDANFIGIDGIKMLKIDEVIHQAFVEVNEEGTEAAAATAVVMTGITVAPKVKMFRADHPFIFIIQERATGNILFLGRVVDPSG